MTVPPPTPGMVPVAPPGPALPLGPPGMLPLAPGPGSGFIVPGAGFAGAVPVIVIDGTMGTSLVVLSLTAVVLVGLVFSFDEPYPPQPAVASAITAVAPARAVAWVQDVRYIGISILSGLVITSRSDTRWAQRETVFRRCSF